jgi:hypothetical protein
MTHAKLIKFNDAATIAVECGILSNQAYRRSFRNRLRAEIKSGRAMVQAGEGRYFVVAESSAIAYFLDVQKGGAA